MAKISIRIMPSAAAKARKPDELKQAALDAFLAAGGGQIHSAPFRSAGQNFALSSRIVVEVDWLPGRVPDRVLRAEAKQPRDARSPRRGPPR